MWDWRRLGRGFLANGSRLNGAGQGSANIPAARSKKCCKFFDLRVF